MVLQPPALRDCTKRSIAIRFTPLAIGFYRLVIAPKVGRKALKAVGLIAIHFTPLAISFYRFAIEPKVGRKALEAVGSIAIRFTSLAIGS